MKHFHRTSLTTPAVLEVADGFFPTIGMEPEGGTDRTRRFSGPIGQLSIEVKIEGGHYTFVEAQTVQTGESRLDRNVKRFFVRLHKRADPNHQLDAAY